MAAIVLIGSVRAQGNFVYTNDNQLVNTVSGFSVAANGTLTPVAGSPFATGGAGSIFGTTGFFASDRIRPAIAGNLLFASNSGSEDVSVFTISASSGALTLVAGSPFPTGNNPASNPFPIPGIAVSATPDGKFLMAASAAAGRLSVFEIAANGALTPITGSPFSLHGSPNGIKVTPDGRFLAVVDTFLGLGFSGVEMFSISSTGTPTRLNETPVGTPFLATPAGVDIDCSSKFLYAGVVEEAPSSVIVRVDGFNIDSNGTLTPVPGSPFRPGAGSNSNVVLLSPDDKTLFVSNQNSHTITAFSVALDGSLSPLAGSPFPMNGSVRSPSGMATNQEGSLLYVADANGNIPPTISIFSVAGNGALTEVAGSPVPTGRPEGLLSLTAFPPKSCVLTAGIKIKAPAAAPVPINPRSRGKISVAILSTLSFNAVTQVVPESLTFGHTGNEHSLAFCEARGEDVNDDGLADLICHFDSDQTDFVKGDSTAVLKGKTFTGRNIQGTEAIRIVPKPR